MTYREIKTMIILGGQPTVAQINEAIDAQTTVVGRAARSMAKHVAIVIAKGGHPYPLPEDQEGRVVRRLAGFQREQDRLCRLFVWRELVEKAPKTAPAGLGSA